MVKQIRREKEEKRQKKARGGYEDLGIKKKERKIY